MIQLVQVAKPSPVRPPGLGGGKAVRPLLSPLSFAEFFISRILNVLLT